jgi:hypothetical protein
MNASRAAVIVVGINLVAVWVAAAAGGRTGQPESTVTAPRVTPEAVVSEAQASLVNAAQRLEAHARAPRPERASTRDPFQFASRADSAARPARGARFADLPAAESLPASEAAEPAVAGGSEEPGVVLEGMAESQDGDTVVRTAILKVGPDLVLATLGTRIDGRYEVVALSSDAVELENLVDHSRRTCRLK